VGAAAAIDRVARQPYDVGTKRYRNAASTRKSYDANQAAVVVAH